MFKVFQVTGTVSFKIDGKVDDGTDDNFVINIIGGPKMPMLALEQRATKILHEKHDGTFPDDGNKKKKHKITVYEVYFDSVNVVADNVYTMV